MFKQIARTTALSLVVFAIATFSSVGVHAAVPGGEPYINLTFTDVFMPPLWTDVDRNRTHDRLVKALTEYPEGPLYHRPSWINGTDESGLPVVKLYEIQVPFFPGFIPSPCGVVCEGNLEIWINKPELSFVEKFQALNEVVDQMNAGKTSFFAPHYRVDTAKLIENQLPTGTFNLAPPGKVYVNQTSQLIKLFLSHPPINGTKVSYDVAPVVGGAVTVFPTTVTIAWPQLHGWFRVLAGPDATTTNFNINLNPGLTTDPTTAWGPGIGVFGQSIEVLAKETFGIDSSAVTAGKTYDGQPSPPIKVRANSFIDSFFDAVVTPVSTPPGLVFTPLNISLANPGVDVNLIFSGATGSYNISYIVPQPWFDENGEQRGKQNNFFEPINTITSVTILNKLNIVQSPAPVPLAYEASPADGTHGGAYSRTVTLTLDALPNSGLTITFDTAGAPAVAMSPASVTFTPLSATRSATVSFRSTAQGVFTIRYILSGASKNDYTGVAPTTWTVNGPNTGCGAAGTLAACFLLSGCQWDSVASACTPTPLPLSISDVPLLYAGETSPPITLTLRTAVQTSLTVTPSPSERFTFSPASFTIAVGSTTGVFRIVAKLARTDPPGSHFQSFKMLLTGADARHHQQSVFTKRVRSTIRCELRLSTFSLYPDIETETPFEVTCDEPPSDNVTFTFRPKTVGLQPQFIVGTDIVIRALPPVNFSANNATLFFDNGTSQGSFMMKGTTVRKFNMTFERGGANKVRFTDLEPIVMRVVELGDLQVPPSFSIVQYTQTQFLHLDMSRQPPSGKDFDVHIQVINAATNTPIGGQEVLISPSETISFLGGQPARQGFYVYSNTTGNYKLRFTVSGPGTIYYNAPTPAQHDVLFSVVAPWEGSAFQYWQDFAHLPSSAKKGCRLNHGYRSHEFTGQLRPLLQSAICKDIVNRSSGSALTCSAMTTHERCYFALEQQNYPCAWVNHSCHFVEPLLGNMVQFGVGATFTAFLDANGTVWTIGDETSGQLGHESGVGKLGYVNLPEKIETIAVGSHFVMALGSQGVVYSWGENFAGQLGQGVLTSYSLQWGTVLVPRGENVTCISAGSSHAGLLTFSGKAFVWGSNEFGQVGTNVSKGRNGAVREPVEVNRTAINEESIVSIHLGAQYTAISSTRNLYTFGGNSIGQLARPGFDDHVPGRAVWRSSSEFVPIPQYNSFVRCPTA